MKAIGGYFELELPPGKEFYPDALMFQSARAAFLALLRVGAPRRVWMPRFICGSMFAPLYQADIECLFYSIDDKLDISDQIKLDDGDWLLYVNYFGICSRQVDRVLTRFNPYQVVIDNSQAFFSPSRDCLATIYSPRKFFGVPDGGLLFSQLQISLPEEEDSGSLNRMVRLLTRLAESPEAGYEDYQRAEMSLQDIEPRRMSRLTQRLLLSLDFEVIRRKRNDNFRSLHERLGEYNPLQIDLSAVDGPLCYPFITKEAGLRQELINERIFVPTYWPDILSREDEGSYEYWMVNACLALPCDQRYDKSEMERILAIVNPGRT